MTPPSASSGAAHMTLFAMRVTQRGRERPFARSQSQFLELNVLWESQGQEGVEDVLWGVFLLMWHFHARDGKGRQWMNGSDVTLAISFGGCETCRCGPPW